MAAADHRFLSQALPVLLPGPWPLAAFTATPYQQWVLVDEHTDAILGFAETMLTLDECELLGIAMLPQWQRRGLGALLLQEVLQRVRGLGCVRCHLEVRRGNAVAQRLYDNAGFEKVGVRRGYYPAVEGAREDAILYSRSLIEEEINSQP